MYIRSDWDPHNTLPYASISLNFGFGLIDNFLIITTESYLGGCIFLVDISQINRENSVIDDAIFLQFCHQQMNLLVCISASSSRAWGQTKQTVSLQTR